jgi:hypothetical protein
MERMNTDTNYLRIFGNIINRNCVNIGTQKVNRGTKPNELVKNWNKLQQVHRCSSR